jgi:hypothetical protein
MGCDRFGIRRGRRQRTEDRGQTGTGLGFRSES